MSALARPWCCPEPRCTPIYQLTDGADDLDIPLPGQAFLCFGQMPETIEFVYDGDRHRNDVRSCNYTPLKGVVAYQETVDDWRLLGAAYNEAARTLEALVIQPSAEDGGEQSREKEPSA